MSNHTQNSPGTVYLVGSGPGDSGLLTIKGMELISSADVIVHDYLAGNFWQQFARKDAELIYVGKKGKNHTLEQTDINSLIISKAKEGKSVCRLKGGDPYVFGRGGEEAEELVQAGIPFEVVPGITSAISAPAYAGIPVTHRDHASQVTFITGHEDPTKEESAMNWHNLAENPGTLVFLMGVKNIENISASLIKAGKDPNTPAALVRWGTTPKQQSLFSTLKKIPAEAERRKFAAPAVLVVGTVVGLHEKLDWFERKPLFGKKILITRSREQSRKMAESVTKAGGEPILFPTIAIEDVKDFNYLDEAINSISRYDWVIFTSVNGVERFFKRFFTLSNDIRQLSGPRIGAIGPITAAKLKDKHLHVELIAQEFVAEGLLESLEKIGVPGKRFLIPRAEKAREILPDGLTKLGGKVDVVSVYRTVLPSNDDVQSVVRMIDDGEIDAITFTSSSTVSHFMKLVEPEGNKLLEKVITASIGPVTSNTLREYGISPQIEASEYTIEGLISALKNYFGDQSRQLD